MATVYTLAANLAIAVSKLLGAFTLVADLAIAVTENFLKSRGSLNRQWMSFFDVLYLFGFP